MKKKNKVVFIQTKAHLRSQRWVNDFIKSINRGGKQDQELIRSILSKLADSGVFDMTSGNKILYEIVEASLSVLSNPRLARILVELEKPFTYTTFADVPKGSSDILGLPQAKGYVGPLTSLSPAQQRAFIRGQLAATPNNGVFKAPGSWDYQKVMRKLDRQSSKKRIDIGVGNQSYTLKNFYREGAYESADRIYESIRECDTDICDISKNTGLKADNIKNVKDHIFYAEHDLDRYGPDRAERKRFDANLQQTLAWKRLETGSHTQEDITWLKHECVKRHHELKYGSGYSEAHERAQSRFDGAPWDDEF